MKEVVPVPRHIVVGNSRLLVNMDRHTFIREIYYPYVGQLNHVGGFQCRVGIWIDGIFSWLNEEDWHYEYRYREDSLVSDVIATHGRLGVSLRIQDGVHQRDNILIKRIHIMNRRSIDREVRIFFHQDLCINETEVGDTAVYYPLNQALFHYKRDKYFMFNGITNSGGIDQYTTGVKRFHSAVGTWVDAEDGHLMGNAIAQGSVDSTIAFKLKLPASGNQDMYYWMTVGEKLEEVISLNTYVIESGPGNLLDRVATYWMRWANKNGRNYADLSVDVVQQFKHSLLIVRSQTNYNGAIIAANDSDIMHNNRDHYSYMWPRDGAMIAYAMSMAGYRGTVAPFYEFCANVLSPEGFLYHKYNPDGTIGSSWHPYLIGGEIRLPIQEDETALVLFALWKDYELHGSIEFTQSLYGRLIRKAANFIAEYMEEQLDLPRPSYDLWEERYGIYTFTASAVYGGLEAASNFCHLFGDERRSDRYRKAADRIKRGILKHLWDEKSQRFIRGLYNKDGVWVQDLTLESSVFGVYEFGVLPANDPMVISTMQAIKGGLSVKTGVGGIARYRLDYYFQRTADIDRVPGNPWIICTLWVAEWEIDYAATIEDLAAPRRTLEWVASHAMEGGNLSEQLDPFDGTPVSVAPLTWSHATYILAVVKYMNKYAALMDINETNSLKEPALQR
jgi:GH15 family glucan-1,4-alpha-glucosidase